jgi:hypothetical protein
VTKREWQIEMANRFAKRDNVKELEAKLECYERLVDSINMASNPVSEKSRVALRNVREMKTIMTKEEEIRKAVEAEREACAKICDLAMLQNQEAINELENDEHIAKCFIQGAMNQLVKTAKAIRARGQA